LGAAPNSFPSLVLAGGPPRFGLWALQETGPLRSPPMPFGTRQSCCAAGTVHLMGRAYEGKARKKEPRSPRHFSSLTKDIYKIDRSYTHQSSSFPFLLVVGYNSRDHFYKDIIQRKPFRHLANCWLDTKVSPHIYHKEKYSVFIAYPSREMYSLFFKLNAKNYGF